MAIDTAGLIALIHHNLVPLEGYFLLYGVGYFTIYQLYAFLLPISPILLILRTKFGSVAYLPVIAAVWAYNAGLGLVPAPPLSLVHLGYFFGVGNHGGPTPVHSLIFVVFGMAIGQLLLRRRPLLVPGVVIAVIVSGASLVVLSYVSYFGFPSVLNQLSDIWALRGHNDPAYYAIGIVGFVPLLVVAACLNAIRWRRFSQLISTVGGHTFSYFFIGNVILLCVSSFTGNGHHLNILVHMGAIAGFLLVSVLSLQLWIVFDRKCPRIMGTKDKCIDYVIGKGAAVLGLFRAAARHARPSP